jgi:hypothetical protein
MFCRTISSFLFSLPILQGVFFYCFIHQVCTLLLLEKVSIQVIPQMLSLAINFPTQKFLQAQSKVRVLQL